MKELKKISKEIKEVTNAHVLCIEPKKEKKTKICVDLFGGVM